jgi:hypothetical protein
MDIPLITSIFGACGSVATAVGVVVLAWQVRVAARTAELQIYADLNLQFLDFISHLSENINKEGVSLSDLTEQERRALDRWFYLANMEYVVYNKRLLDSSLLTQWAEGIAAAAKKPIFLERWNTTASKFRLDPGFRNLFEEAERRSRGPHA